MSFTDRMSQVLDRLDEIHNAEVARLKTRLAAAQRTIDAIPSCYPDGTAILSPEQWLAWALPKLGYSPGVGIPQTPKEN